MEFEERTKNLIKQIPRGRVATYAQIASLAGNYRAARQVGRVLHTSSEKDHLPWHRVVNSRGQISLKPGSGFETQKHLLMREGVKVSADGRIELDIFLWDEDNSSSGARERLWAELRRSGKRF